MTCGPAAHGNDVDYVFGKPAANVTRPAAERRTSEVMTTVRAHGQT
jgi:hypothetical protein